VAAASVSSPRAAALPVQAGKASSAKPVSAPSSERNLEWDGDPNVKPIVGKPREDIEQRTHDQIGIEWDSFKGQVVNALKVQIMPARLGFEQGFQDTNGKEVMIKPPKGKTHTVVKKLKEHTSYVFRLVAINDAGVGIGEPTEPISTSYCAPARGDKSAWFNVLPDRKMNRTLGRRLSLRKANKTQRLWLVLDGALLSWFKAVGACACCLGGLSRGAEIGNGHVGGRGGSGLLPPREAEGNLLPPAG
jgi:hypothetical protein